VSLVEDCALPAVAVDLATVTVSREVLDLVSPAFAARYDLVPLRREGGRLCVAIGDSSGTEGLDALGSLSGLEIIPGLAPLGDVRAAIGRWYGRALATHEDRGEEDEPAAFGGADESSTREEMMADENDAPIVALVEGLIQEGVRRRASDIHLEPMARRLRVRYRVDGVLAEAGDPPKRLQAAIISRLKIMADISIAEKRVPQDGRIQVNLAGRALDLRVSTVPSVHGESLVLRLLDQEALQPGLAELGFLDDHRRTLERLLALPDGIVLVTGPTGSGKTTTLYSCLHDLNQPDRKIITVEDPVEYQLAGVNQVPVRQEIGMTFAAALRAMLRQSPNIVMVGEIRDRETAEVALNASLTGHMVFSTLHTNDAAGAVTRLIELGVKPFLVAASLRAVLAQRLVRRLCAECRRPNRETQGAYRKGDGCPGCQGTGYRGRVGIFELLVVDGDLQAMIHSRASAPQLRQKARQLGMRTMREDGLRKVTAGLTTVEEVVSITASDSA